MYNKSVCSSGAVKQKRLILMKREILSGISWYPTPRLA